MKICHRLKSKRDLNLGDFFLSIQDKVALFLENIFWSFFCKLVLGCNLKY